MESLDSFAADKLAELAAGGLGRELRATGARGGARVARGGRELVSFCSNDYLGLAGDPRIVEAAARALSEHGLGAGASRLVTGNHPLFAVLERKLAEIKGSAEACVFGSGYLANLGVAPALAGRGDLVLLDALSHASMHTGARLSRARVEGFAHNDAASCRRLLARLRAAHRRCLILTEGVFSMDGDRAPLGPLAELAAEFDAWLLVDDAHGFGVLGGGAGAAAEAAPAAPVPLHIGTLSKAVGAYGGFLAASAPVCALMRSRARSLVYSTGLPAPVVAGAVAGLEAIAAEPGRVAAPLRHARLFAAAAGLPAPESQIVPIRLGAPEAAVAAASALEDRGFLVTAIRPPTVPEGTSRLRLTFSAAHGRTDVERLAAAAVALGLAPGRAAARPGGLPPDLPPSGGRSRTPA